MSKDHEEQRVKSLITAIGIIAKSAGADVFVSVRIGETHISDMISDDIKFLSIGIKTLFPDDMQGKLDMIEKLRSFSDELAFCGVSIINTMQAYESIVKSKQDEEQYRNPN